MSSQVHILTGGTSGMGLHIAKALARRSEDRIIVGARRPETATALRAAVPERQLTVLPLDLESLASVSEFAAQVSENLDGKPLKSVMCNAGLQLTGSREMVAPGVERSFHVNFLSHLHLVDMLKPRLQSHARVVTVGSGTHNPDDKIAKMFGFRGAFFPAAADVARGDLGISGSDKQLNMDRYATSKLCAIYHALHMASEMPETRCKFYAFDPGLMPGTALARDRSAFERFGWTYLLPVLRPLLRGVSSSAASADALVAECIYSDRHRSGDYVEFTGSAAPRSDLSRDVARATELIKYSRGLISKVAEHETGPSAILA